MVKVNRSKIILIIGIIIITLSILFIFVGSKKNKVSIKQDNDIYAHTEENIIKEEEYSGIKYSNISMLTENDYTTFTADVTNVSDKDITNERFHISLKNKDGEEVIKLLAYIPNGLKKGEMKTITASAHGSFTDVVSKEIVE